MIKDKLQGQSEESAAQGRLRSRSAAGTEPRPSQPTATAPLGLHRLELDSSRDGLLYVPHSYTNNQLAPLILMLHGAGGDAEGALNILQGLADAVGAILLGVDSRHQTWDVIMGQYGTDITFIDQALAQIFSRYAIDPSQIAIAGFSDGASYALSVGITNGDLFTDVIAFSPGFMSPVDQVGKPRLYISHGTDDRVLPIDRCSRRIVPQLQQATYEVLYREFNGGHTVPRAIAQEAMNWFVTKIE